MNKETLRVFAVVSLIILAFALLCVVVVLQKKELEKEIELLRTEHQVSVDSLEKVIQTYQQEIKTLQPAE